MPYILKIISGILALGIGAEMIVRSSINLANIYKISGYFIGFTIIALGTSLPELAASIQAINEVNSVGIAIGNIIGSNIANILLILGVIAIIVSEVSINYTSSNIFQNIYLIALPILLFFLVYTYFQIKIKKSNLIT
mgnify:CR=1 FL=1